MNFESSFNLLIKITLLNPPGAGESALPLLPDDYFYPVFNILYEERNHGVSTSTTRGFYIN